MDAICVFCGSATGSEQRYAERAGELGTLLAREGIRVIYGGAHVGTMGVLADAALAEGGEVTGVIPESMVDRELAHRTLTELHIVAGMHERKAMMAGLADAFIALPGGIGTLEELFEIWTWRQLGLHGKPLGLLDEAGFFQPLLRMVDHMVAEGFLDPANRDALAVDREPSGLLRAVTAGAAQARPDGAAE
ncbi:TIGR00730 family Rossman fold protein [Haloechinothrix sp. LS1_15]|uniref:LOG family protein n=1 Tax=Haloechinothrix sp. LS1_15 TaxID=2652248 RepID=UPI0029482E91|nr:TIGR00730 family Rossman fold protein [Haloechinothrix sp. LS1_15]MDV6013903.1 TIGR00730 family Rossman fold protein [Haloechinothrix sp. LS1_15]